MAGQGGRQVRSITAHRIDSAQCGHCHLAGRHAGDQGHGHLPVEADGGEDRRNGAADGSGEAVVDGWSHRAQRGRRIGGDEPDQHHQRQDDPPSPLNEDLGPHP